MTRRLPAALLAWLAFVAACVAVIAQTRFTGDLSAFLPGKPTAEQQVLVDQLKNGMVSRLLLIGIEGGDAKARADVSRTLARTLVACLILLAAPGPTSAGEPKPLTTILLVAQPELRFSRSASPIGVRRPAAMSAVTLLPPAGITLACAMPPST